MQLPPHTDEQQYPAAARDDGVTSGLEVYKALSQMPTYKSATFLDGGVVLVESSVRSHEMATRQSFTRSLFLQSDSNVIASTPPVLLPSDKSERLSPSTKLKAVFSSDKQYNKYFIQVISTTSGFPIAEITIDPKVCGAFLSGETWGHPQFSQDENKILFAAHLPQDAALKQGLIWHKNTWTMSFGELNRDVYHPALFIYTIDTNTIAQLPLPSPSANFSVAQGIFSPVDCDIVIATGWGTLPDGRRLGNVYCTNRPGGIYFISLKDNKSEWKLISSPEISARSPRVIDDKTVAFLHNPLGCAHNSSTAFSTFDPTSLLIELPTIKPVIKAVENPKTIDAFAGLYFNNVLPTFDFQLKGGFVLSTIHRSRNTLFFFTLMNDDDPIELTAPSTEEGYGGDDGPAGDSWTLLGTDGRDTIVASKSGLNVLPTLWIGKVVGSVKGEVKVEWKLVKTTCDKTDELNSKLSTLSTKLIVLPSDSGLTPPVETIVLVSSPTAPLIINLHGGPHSSTTSNFDPSIAALAVSGFNVASVNYTGGLGFGDGFSNSLVGQCGILDRDDCEKSTKELLRRGIGQEGNVFVQGGSHGGYLTAHLTSSYPTLFKSAILRNPVVDIGLMSGISDIPDWCYAELALSYPLSPSQPKRVGTTPSPMEYEFMLERSPIKKVGDVECDTLIMMGDIDFRVPPPQSKAWYHGVRGNGRKEGKKVEMVHFAGEGHSLDGVEAEDIKFELGLKWFLGKY